MSVSFFMKLTLCDLITCNWNWLLGLVDLSLVRRRMSKAPKGGASDDAGAPTSVARDS